jgi:hypothetical protein
MKEVPGWVSTMSQYRIEAKCEVCGDRHPVDVMIDLDDGPSERMSLIDAFTYRDRPIPGALVGLVRRPPKPCPVKGKPTAQRSNFLIYLTPL